MNEEFKIYLEKETDFIFDNYDSFVDRFIKLNIIDMYEVRFGSADITFVYITDEGCHTVDGIDFNEYEEWKNSLKDTK